MNISRHPSTIKQWPHRKPPTFQQKMYTPENETPKNGGLEDEFPFQCGYFQVPCGIEHDDIRPDVGTELPRNK